MTRTVLVVIAVVAFAACAKAKKVAPPSSDADPNEAQLHELENVETKLRASTDWATFPSSDTTLGPDPIDIVALDGGGYAAILRGADALVLLDDDGTEIAREKAPRAPRALTHFTVGDHEAIGVVGELSNAIWFFHVAAPAIRKARAPHLLVSDDDTIAPVGVDGMRGVACWMHGKDTVMAVVGDDGALRVLGKQGVVDVGPGAFGLKHVGPWLVSMSVLGHRIVAVPVDDAGVLDEKHVVHVDNDGPFWGFDARIVDGALEIAAGHVEDHALDRSGGSFGYIDSFVRVVRIDPATSQPTTIAEVNASEHGVVIPKAIAFLDDKTVLAIGAGSGKGMQIDVDHLEQIEDVRALPGIASIAIAGNKVMGADPLLDAFVALDAEPRPIFVEPRASSTRSVDSKVGEALVFTTVMAPRQKSDGVLSRFTCEACHFEGGGDGRVHDTSRKDDDGHSITATTKPLFGLFNNKPLFTRAMDENLTQMAHAEFRVANANSALDPWFALTPADAPWLSYLGVTGTLTPLDLRRDLVAFLHDFTPRTNAHVVAHGTDASKRRFTADEAKGAAVFRDRCVQCHRPTLIGDDSKTVQPFEAWERFVLSDNGPLVWSGDGRVRTGIEPLVHPEGARPSSLRRIDRKHPYFTNGSAKTFADVAGMLRFDTSTSAHMSKRTDLGALSSDDQRALVAFLRLL